MFSTIALIAAAAVAPAQAAELPAGAFDPLTANYRTATGDYCVRSGWQTATWQTGRPVRAGDCRTANDWRTRGIEFTPVKRAPATPARGLTVAAR